MTRALLLVLLAAACSTVGNLLLKHSRTASTFGLPAHLSPWFGAAIVFYVLNLFLFAKALDRLPVSTGYPILAGVGFAMLTVCATALLGERFSLLQALGLLLVTAGVVCLARSA